MPDHLAAHVATWREFHPCWEFRFWDEHNLPPLRNQRLYDDAESIAPHNVGQFRADILRYELLLNEGGIWADTDLECLRPLDALLSGVDCFAGWERQSQWVGNTILGSIPGHPFYEDLVRGLAANVRRRAGSRPARMSGPQYLTPVYRRHAKAVTVFAQEKFYPYAYDELDRQGESFPDAYTVHHWNAQRNRKASLA